MPFFYYSTVETRGISRHATRHDPFRKFPTGPDKSRPASHVRYFSANEDGPVTRILPVSSGNEKKFRDEGQCKMAHTPRGPLRDRVEDQRYQKIEPCTSLLPELFFSVVVRFTGATRSHHSPRAMAACAFPVSLSREFLR